MTAANCKNELKHCKWVNLSLPLSLSLSLSFSEVIITAQIEMNSSLQWRLLSEETSSVHIVLLHLLFIFFRTLKVRWNSINKALHGFITILFKHMSLPWPNSLRRVSHLLAMHAYRSALSGKNPIFRIHYLHEEPWWFLKWHSSQLQSAWTKRRFFTDNLTVR